MDRWLAGWLACCGGGGGDNDQFTKPCLHGHNFWACTWMTAFQLSPSFCKASCTISRKKNSESMKERMKEINAYSLSHSLHADYGPLPSSCFTSSSLRHSHNFTACEPEAPAEPEKLARPRILLFFSVLVVL